MDDAEKPNNLGILKYFRNENGGSVTEYIAAIGAGMLVEGWQAAASVKKDAEVARKLRNTSVKLADDRLARVARGSIVGGMRFGVMLATFYGVHNLLVETRGVQDLYNVALGSSVAFGIMDTATPGTLLQRSRNAMFGSVVAAAIYLPLAWACLKLFEPEKEGSIDHRVEPSDMEDIKHDVGAPKD